MANDKKLTSEQVKALDEAEAILDEAAGRAEVQLRAAGFRPRDDEETGRPCLVCSCPQFTPTYENPSRCRQPNCNHGVHKHRIFIF